MLLLFYGKIKNKYNKEEIQQMNKVIKEWFLIIAAVLIILFLVTKFLITPYTVNGMSMYPTFHDKDKVVVSKLSKTLNHLNRGDVIVFHQNRNSDYIKRIIGEPGDTVVYKNDQLWVNNKVIKEPYLSYNKKHKYGKTLTEDFKVQDLKGSNSKSKIPEGKYLVLGDNRQNSIDSRRSEVGLISNKQIVGKVIIRYWPLNSWQSNFNISFIYLYT